MPELICDTTAIQYLHQLGLLHLLRHLGDRVSVPPAVVEELEQGRSAGIDLPDVAALDWISLRRPEGEPDVRLVSDMGPGETAVLMLALESTDAVALVDDGLARKRAEILGIPFSGTIGILLDAKENGLVQEVAPFLDQLDSLGFRLARHVRQLALERAREL